MSYICGDIVRRIQAGALGSGSGIQGVVKKGKCEWTVGAGEQSYFTFSLNSMALKSVLLSLVLGQEQQLKHEPARVVKSVMFSIYI